MAYGVLWSKAPKVYFSQEMFGKCVVNITDWELVWCSSFLLELYQACCPEMHTRFRLFMINITNFLVALILTYKSKYICNAVKHWSFNTFSSLFLCVSLFLFILETQLFLPQGLRFLSKGLCKSCICHLHSIIMSTRLISVSWNFLFWHGLSLVSFNACYTLVTKTVAKLTFRDLLLIYHHLQKSEILEIFWPEVDSL